MRAKLLIRVQVPARTPFLCLIVCRHPQNFNDKTCLTAQALTYYNGSIVNRKSVTERAKIIELLCEGNSLRATSRITRSSINTVLKLFVEVGQACQKYHDAHVRNLKCTKIQVDELHSFVYTRRERAGDAWVWISMCPDSKLVTNWHVGDRDTKSAIVFMRDLAGRLKNRVHLVSDGYTAYEEAVDEVFGDTVNFSMLIKQYDELSRRRRYKGAARKNKVGSAPIKEISTSYIERQNLTVRMSCRRFTRRSNAFSKKIENHRHALALHFMFYNFCRVHSTLRVTPAMEAGLTGHIWSLEEIVVLADMDLPVFTPPPLPKKPIDKKPLPASYFRKGRGRKGR